MEIQLGTVLQELPQQSITHKVIHNIWYQLQYISCVSLVEIFQLKHDHHRHISQISCRIIATDRMCSTLYIVVRNALHFTIMNAI